MNGLNNAFSYNALIPHYDLSAVWNNLKNRMSPTQKIIVAIAGIAIATATTFFLVYKCFLERPTGSKKPDASKKNQENYPIEKSISPHVELRDDYQSNPMDKSSYSSYKPYQMDTSSYSGYKPDQMVEDCLSDQMDTSSYSYKSDQMDEPSYSSYQPIRPIQQSTSVSSFPTIIKPSFSSYQPVQMDNLSFSTLKEIDSPKTGWTVSSDSSSSSPSSSPIQSPKPLRDPFGNFGMQTSRVDQFLRGRNPSMMNPTSSFLSSGISSSQLDRLNPSMMNPTSSFLSSGISSSQLDRLNPSMMNPTSSFLSPSQLDQMFKVRAPSMMNSTSSLLSSGISQSQQVPTQSSQASLFSGKQDENLTGSKTSTYVNPYQGRPDYNPNYGKGNSQDPQIKHDLHLVSLLKMEEEILKLDDEIEKENDALEANFSDDLADKIIKLNTELAQMLLDYPKTLQDYLKNRFSSMSKKDQEIFEHFVTLSGILQRNSDQHNQFVIDCMEQIDDFLTTNFFNSPTESCLSEEKKGYLIVFQELFSIINVHYQVILKEDPRLAHRLKIKLANLPLVDGNVDRKKEFKNIYLSKSDQRKILQDHFQQKEDAAIDLAIAYIKTSNLTSKESILLSELVVKDKSQLSKENQLKLINALKSYREFRVPSDWNNREDVLNSLNTFLRPFGHMYGSYNNDMNELYLASEAKGYFEKQTEIPRWYHATRLEYIKQIIIDGEVQVQHKQAYSGAWVSTQRESSFGDGSAVLVFNHKITKIDPEVFIGFEKGKTRWRGLQKAIPIMKTTNDPYLALVGLRDGVSEKDKEEIKNNLITKGIKNPVIVSLDLIDYIQRQVIFVLGNPNLSEKWWGKGEVKDLDKVL